VPGTIGDHVTENLFAEQSQIADEIKHFVAHKFIIKAQGRVHEAISREDHSIFRRSATDKPLLAHGVGFVQKAKCARRRNLPNVISI